jgi:hypothetical protein
MPFKVQSSVFESEEKANSSCVGKDCLASDCGVRSSSVKKRFVSELALSRCCGSTLCMCLGHAG